MEEIRIGSWAELNDALYHGSSHADIAAPTSAAARPRAYAADIDCRERV